jgi:hypothetical protein
MEGRGDGTCRNFLALTGILGGFYRRARLRAERRDSPNPAQTENAQIYWDGTRTYTDVLRSHEDIPRGQRYQGTKPPEFPQGSHKEAILSPSEAQKAILAWISGGNGSELKESRAGAMGTKGYKRRISHRSGGAGGSLGPLKSLFLRGDRCRGLWRICRSLGTSHFRGETVKIRESTSDKCIEIVINGIAAMLIAIKIGGMVQ